MGVDDCREFQQKFFESQATDISIAIQALAYESGLCVSQNLDKAREAYEQAFERTPSHPYVSLRLGLLYAFGPASSRNEARARFFMRQTVIALAPVLQEDKPSISLRKFLRDQPSPALLEQELEWIRNLLRKSFAERQQIAEDLKGQGYYSTDFLWLLSDDDFKSMQLK
ncbi:MAG: hypothetical protein L6Q57_02755 [Alphaproteobacteria bacterium]|nr:hypothetical protein [Alphaproteobacteria bacterium]